MFILKKLKMFGWWKWCWILAMSHVVMAKEAISINVNLQNVSIRAINQPLDKVLVKIAGACQRCISVQGDKWPSVSLNYEKVPCSSVLEKLVRAFKYVYSQHAACDFISAFKESTQWIPVRYGTEQIMASLSQGIKKEYGGGSFNDFSDQLNSENTEKIQQIYAADYKFLEGIF